MVRMLCEMSSPTPPIAPGNAVHKPAVFINERNCHAVNFQFHDPLDFFARQEFTNALAELFQLLNAVRILDGQHGHAMFDLLEPFDRLVAHALRGAVGRDQIGMVGLQLFQPLDQQIVLAIG